MRSVRPAAIAGVIGVLKVPDGKVPHPIIEKITTAIPDRNHDAHDSVTVYAREAFG